MAARALASDTQTCRRLAPVIAFTGGRRPGSERCSRSRTHGAAEGSARCLRLVHRGGGSRASAPPSLRGRAARDRTGGSVAACCQPRRMVLATLLLQHAPPLLLSLSIKISRLDALNRSAMGKRQMRCARHHLLGVQLCIHATPDRHAATGRSRAMAVLLQPGWAVLAAVATGRRRQPSYANNQAVKLVYLTIKISSKRDDVRGTVEVLTIGTSKARVTGCSISVMLRPTAVVPVE